MKKTIKGIVVGFIITTMLMSTVLGAQVKSTIEVIYNSVNLTVNGIRVNADNILYNGTTYVPIRAVAEALGKDVGWDQGTNTASVNDKGEKGGVITVDQVPYKINILEPNSIGTVWMQATYTNNTKYPMTGFSMTVLLKDKNEKAYLSNYDTVMPGETSSLFDTFGPQTMNIRDLEILKIEIRAQNTNGKTLTVDYDTKLKKYEYYEY